MTGMKLGKWAAAFACVSVGTLTAGAMPAAADTTSFTDPAGDVHVVADTCGVGGIPCNSPSPIAEPTIDIEAGELSADADSITASLTVVDADGQTTFAALSRNFAFEFMATEDIFVSLVYDGDSGASISVFDLFPSNTSTMRALSGFSIDNATDTVQWEVPLDLLNEMIGEVCSTCSLVGTGTVLTPTEGRSSRQTPSEHLNAPVLADRIEGSGTVTVG